MKTENIYLPFLSEIIEVIPHTDIEYTFRMRYEGDVRPGQFFEVSIPKFGEAPISVSGIGPDYVDLTIRRVGKVTDEIFEHYVGQKLYMRGPYGNRFELSDYTDSELVIVGGGTGVSPVRGVIDYFANHPEEVRSAQLIAGFKSGSDILFRDDFKRWKDTMDVTLTVDAGEETPEHKVGLVTQFIPELEFEDLDRVRAIVVGPPAMMRFSVKALLDRGIAEENIWISQERRMCCGIGKCGHCRIGDSYVCLDGPVYNYAQGRRLAD